MYHLDKPPPFDPDAPRDDVWGSSDIRYMQNGHYYSATGKYQGSEGEAPPEDENDPAVALKRRRAEALAKARKSKVEKALQRASLKTKKPSGLASKVMAGEAVPAEVARAERENMRAKQAEELAE